MQRAEIHRILGHAVADRRLLEHPFYRRWEAGTLQPGELAAYAGQYRHFEAALPALLESVIDALEPGTARDAVQANLDDERSVPAPHLSLFDDFCRSIGADTGVAATPATEALLCVYRDAVALSPAAALAALGAYEVQSPGVAASKAEGLRMHYGVDDTGARFWDVHAEMDEEHAQWTTDAIALLVTAAAADAADAELAVADAARRGAEAWWAFLDEREAAAPVPVSC
ncbi:MAG: iron-containing redox enzyme family protein [Acidimicrobiales bacterium]